MSDKRNTGADPTAKELAEAKRIAALPEAQQRQHPAALPADAAKLNHINTYGRLPEFYIDKPFRCRDCGKEEIWKAADQKWYYEEAKGTWMRRRSGVMLVAKPERPGGMTEFKLRGFANWGQRHRYATCLSSGGHRLTCEAFFGDHRLRVDMAG